MRTGKWECPVCYWQQFDCAAYDSGVCIALASTRFNRDRCPFYKSREQVEKEKQRAKEKKEDEEYGQALRRNRGQNPTGG